MTININQAPGSAQAGQSQADWTAAAAANGWNDPAALVQAISKYNNAGTSEFDPSSDPTLQKLINQGYLTPTQIGGSDSSQEVYGAANLPQSASGYAPAFFQQTGANYKGPVIPGGSQKDPLYGDITSNAYLPQSKSPLDTYGPMIASLVGGGMLGVGALGSLFGNASGLGSMGSTLLNFATKIPGMLSGLDTSALPLPSGSPDTSTSSDTLTNLGNNIGLPALGNAPTAIAGGGGNPMVANAIRSILASNFQGQ